MTYPNCFGVFSPFIFSIIQLNWGCILHPFLIWFYRKAMQTIKKGECPITTPSFLQCLSDKSMIYLSSPIFKDILSILSDFNDIYEDYVRNMQLSSLSCPNPSCNSSDFSFNSTYQRYVVFSPDHDSISMNITVVKCNECDTYHALLPAWLFPFHSYTYQFVMLTLYYYYCSPTMKFNKSKVCRKMNIHRSTLNHWIQLIHHQDVLCFLNDSISSFISKLRDRFIDFFDFLKRFNFKYGPFMCSHIRRTFYFSTFSNNSDNCASP